MANRSKTIIEKIKSIIIVVLFFTTILLLCFYWEDISFESIARPAETASTALSAEAVLLPDSIAVCSGNETYELIDDGFAELRESLRVLSQTERIMAEEITEEQYRGVMAYSSIRACFDYYVPFAEFCEYFGVKRPAGSDSIDALTELCYSLGSAENIFVKDGKNNRYYRIMGTPDVDCFSAVKSVIETANIEGGNEYYTLGMYLGEDIENDVLVPLSLYTSLHDFEYEAEFTAEDTETKGHFAKLFFGSTFDFVRKIEEKSGTVIYMYGYGERTLIADCGGTFEYKQEESGTSAVSYFEALDRALQFVAEHGDFALADGTRLAPYIESVQIDPEGKDGYRFCFGLRVGEGRLFYQDAYPFVVDVIGDRVTYFKRDMIAFAAESAGLAGGEPADSAESGGALDAGELVYEEAYSAVNMLAQNTEYISAVLGQAGGKGAWAGGSDQGSRVALGFDDIIGRITGLDYGYVRLDASSSESEEDAAAASSGASLIKACWIVSTDVADIYFDLYTAEPIAYTKSKL